MHERAIPQSFTVVLEASLCLWRRTKHVRWANGSGTYWHDCLHVSERFLQSISLTMADMKVFEGAINAELRRMDPDLAGSDLPLQALADHMEAHGEHSLAGFLRNSADQYFHSVRRDREYRANERGK